MNFINDAITYIRRIIKSPSNAVISDDLIIDYINRFYISDVDARLQLFDLKKTYQFQTIPGVDKYNMPLYNIQLETGSPTSPGTNNQSISYYPVYQGFKGKLRPDPGKESFHYLPPLQEHLCLLKVHVHSLYSEHFLHVCRGYSMKVGIDFATASQAEVQAKLWVIPDRNVASCFSDLIVVFFAFVADGNLSHCFSPFLLLFSFLSLPFNYISRGNKSQRCLFIPSSGQCLRLGYRWK